jgi:hypothetical protein
MFVGSRGVCSVEWLDGSGKKWMWKEVIVAHGCHNIPGIWLGGLREGTETLVAVVVVPVGVLQKCISETVNFLCWLKILKHEYSPRYVVVRLQAQITVTAFSHAHTKCHGLKFIKCRLLTLIMACDVPTIFMNFSSLDLFGRYSCIVAAHALAFLWAFKLNKF